MLIKNKIFVIIILILNCFLFNFNIFAEELNITAGEITFEKDEEMMIAKGSVIIIDSDGNKVKLNAVNYSGYAGEDADGEDTNWRTYVGINQAFKTPTIPMKRLITTKKVISWVASWVALTRRSSWPWVF